MDTNSNVAAIAGQLAAVTALSAAASAGANPIVEAVKPVSSVRKGNKIIYTMSDGTTRTKVYREQVYNNFAH
jgi:hypothetical protein